VSRSAVEDILRKCECGPYEKLVLMSIASHGRGTDGCGGFLSATTIANEACVDRRTVFRILTSLRDKGWLSWTSGNAKKNTANRYDIYLDAIPAHPSGTLPLGPSDTETLPSGTETPPPSGTLPLGLVAAKPKPSGTVPPQASTEAKTKDDDRSSSSFSLRVAQEFWNAHRGPMGESTIRLTSQLERLFATRVKDGFTETVCQQAISKMAALPHFRGETNGNLGDFHWLLSTHKDSGEPNFQKVLRGDYDPHPAKKKKPIATSERPAGGLADMNEELMLRLGPDGYAKWLNEGREVAERESEPERSHRLKKFDHHEAEAKVFFERHPEIGPNGGRLSTVKTYA
jgi:hypothetical protein